MPDFPKFAKSGILSKQGPSCRQNRANGNANTREGRLNLPLTGIQVTGGWQAGDSENYQIFPNFLQKSTKIDKNWQKWKKICQNWKKSEKNLTLAKKFCKKCKIFTKFAFLWHVECVPIWGVKWTTPQSSASASRNFAKNLAKIGKNEVKTRFGNANTPFLTVFFRFWKFPKFWPSGTLGNTEGPFRVFPVCLRVGGSKNSCFLSLFFIIFLSKKNASETSSARTFDKLSIFKKIEKFLHF